MNKLNDKLFGILDDICFGIRELNNIDQKDIDEKQSFTYYPMDASILYNSLVFVNKLVKKENKTFVDYGCGIGLTLRIAKLLGFESIGYDLDKRIVRAFNISSYYYSNGLMKVADLRDSSIYTTKFDVVYFWSPFVDRDLEREFELQALKTVKKSGFLMTTSPSHICNRYEYIQEPLLKELENFTKVIAPEKTLSIWQRIN